jgi:hypothetical protein
VCALWFRRGMDDIDEAEREHTAHHGEHGPRADRP